MLTSDKNGGRKILILMIFMVKIRPNTTQVIKKICLPLVFFINFSLVTKKCLRKKELAS